MLDIIQALLRGRGWRYLRLDGSTATGVRQSLVDDFNKDTSIPIFLASSKAGGLGLNLKSATNGEGRYEFMCR
jgi:SNF2 family DNA or RNA helicase